MNKFVLLSRFGSGRQEECKRYGLLMVVFAKSMYSVDVLVCFYFNIHKNDCKFENLKLQKFTVVNVTFVYFIVFLIYKQSFCVPMQFFHNLRRLRVTK